MARTKANSTRRNNALPQHDVDAEIRARNAGDAHVQDPVTGQSRSASNAELYRGPINGGFVSNTPVYERNSSLEFHELEEAHQEMLLERLRVRRFPRTEFEPLHIRNENRRWEREQGLETDTAEEESEVYDDTEPSESIDSDSSSEEEDEQASSSDDGSGDNGVGANEEGSEDDGDDQESDDESDYEAAPEVTTSRKRGRGAKTDAADGGRPSKVRKC